MRQIQGMDLVGTSLHIPIGYDDLVIEPAGPDFPAGHLRFRLPPAVLRRGWVVLPAEVVVEACEALTKVQP